MQHRLKLVIEALVGEMAWLLLLYLLDWAFCWEYQGFLPLVIGFWFLVIPLRKTGSVILPHLLPYSSYIDKINHYLTLALRPVMLGEFTSFIGSKARKKEKVRLYLMPTLVSQFPAFVGPAQTFFSSGYAQFAFSNSRLRWASSNLSSISRRPLRLENLLLKESK